MEIEDESGALGELGIDVEVTVHLQGHLLADGESETVASGEVANLKEWLEDIFTLLFGDAGTCVRYEELIGVGTAFLEVEADASSCGSVLCGVGKQVEQDVGNVFLIDLGTHIRGIDSQIDVTRRHRTTAQECLPSQSRYCLCSPVQTVSGYALRNRAVPLLQAACCRVS